MAACAAEPRPRPTIAHRGKETTLFCYDPLTQFTIAMISVMSAVLKPGVLNFAAEGLEEDGSSLFFFFASFEAFEGDSDMLEKVCQPDVSPW